MMNKEKKQGKLEKVNGREGRNYYPKTFNYNYEKAQQRNCQKVNRSHFIGNFIFLMENIIRNAVPKINKPIRNPIGSPTKAKYVFMPENTFNTILQYRSPYPFINVFRGGFRW